MIKIDKQPDMGGDKSPQLFVRSLKNGKPSWKLAPAMRARYEDLRLKAKRIENIQDKEIQEAYLALFKAGSMARRLIREGEGIEAIREPEYLTDHPIDQAEGSAAITKVLIPLAHRMNMPMQPGVDPWLWYPQTRADAELLKRNTLNWLESVIDHSFPELLLIPEREILRAVDLIALALGFCRRFDRLPAKKELFAAAYESGIEHWKFKGKGGFNVEGKRSVLIAAGLQDLEKAPRGKVKK